MRDLDDELLGRLAGFTAESGVTLSLVVDLDPSSTATAGELASRVNALVGEAGRLAREEAEDLAVGVEADVERLRDYFENEFERSEARAVAVYASRGDGEVLDVRLTTPWPDELRVGRHFALAPLLPTLERDRVVIVAIIDRRRGTIARLAHGRLSEVDDLSAETHGQHSQGGSSQARYERSAEREVEIHLGDLTERIGQEIEPGSSALLVAVCPEALRNAFLDSLPTHCREAFAGWISAEAHVEPAELSEALDGLVAERLESELQHALEELGDASGDGRAAQGWAEVVPAAWDGRIDTLYVTGSTAQAWECPTCGRGALAEGNCELDGTPLTPLDGGALESATRGTIIHGGRVRLVPPESMQAETPTAALLRLALPPEATKQPT